MQLSNLELKLFIIVIISSVGYITVPMNIIVIFIIVLTITLMNNLLYLLTTLFVIRH